MQEAQSGAGVDQWKCLRAAVPLRPVADAVLDRFSAPTQAWFETSFAAPPSAQERGWPAISAGDHTLLLAPTGSGKTLAAFLAAIDRLGNAPVPAKGKRCRVVYI